MTNELPLATQTLFAELRDQCLDAQFDADFHERGSFIKKRVKREDYWYFQRWQDGTSKQTYAGPFRDGEITKRVEHFSERIKPSFDQRRQIVRALLASGLSRPDATTGALIEALWKAGFFRLRGVLIGTTAFQCYGGLVGTKLGLQSMRTQDADLAQYLAVSREIGDTMPAMDELLHSVDTTFRPILDSIDGRHVVAFVNKSGYRVEFLTPHRGSGQHIGKPVRMPALGGVSAIPLTYLDYLIHDPVRSVLLHTAGVPVTVPSPQRYAIHKLIVSVQRAEGNKVKSAKDLAQAAELIVALGKNRGEVELAEAWIEAWDRGPKWRDALRRGKSLLPPPAFSSLNLSITAGFNLLNESTAGPPQTKDYGF